MLLIISRTDVSRGRDEIFHHDSTIINDFIVKIMLQPQKRAKNGNEKKLWKRKIPFMNTNNCFHHARTRRESTTYIELYIIFLYVDMKLSPHEQKNTATTGGKQLDGKFLTNFPPFHTKTLIRKWRKFFIKTLSHHVVFPLQLQTIKIKKFSLFLVFFPLK